MVHKIKIDCNCIDLESRSDLLVALDTAREVYRDIAKTMQETTPDISTQLNKTASNFDRLGVEIGKIRLCP